jgi:hypothetical protein
MLSHDIDRSDEFIGKPSTLVLVGELPARLRLRLESLDLRFEILCSSILW